MTRQFSSVDKQMKQRHSLTQVWSRGNRNKSGQNTGYLRCVCTDSGLAGDYYTLVKTNIINGENIRSY